MSTRSPDQPRGHWAEQRSWLIPEVFDDDGEPIVDEVAIHTMVSGKRKVRSTHTERRRAIIAMVANGLTILEMAERIGTRSQEIMKYLADLGFEIREDLLLDPSHRRKLIVPPGTPAVADVKVLDWHRNRHSRRKVA